MIRRREDQTKPDAADVRSKFPNANANQLKVGDKESGVLKQSPRAPIAGFVSTTILKSTQDGFFGEKSTEERVQGQDSATTQATVSDSRPLYERLKEQRDQKDLEWKEQHNMFGMYSYRRQA